MTLSEIECLDDPLASLPLYTSLFEDVLKRMHPDLPKHVGISILTDSCASDLLDYQALKAAIYVRNDIIHNQHRNTTPLQIAEAVSTLQVEIRNALRQCEPRVRQGLIGVRPRRQATVIIPPRFQVRKRYDDPPCYILRDLFEESSHTSAGMDFMGAVLGASGKLLAVPIPAAMLEDDNFDRHQLYGLMLGLPRVQRSAICESENPVMADTLTVEIDVRVSGNKTESIQRADILILILGVPVLRVPVKDFTSEEMVRMPMRLFDTQSGVFRSLLLSDIRGDSKQNRDAGHDLRVSEAVRDLLDVPLKDSASFTELAVRSFLEAKCRGTEITVWDWEDQLCLIKRLAHF